jgi:cysteine-rich repeat protein
MTYNQEPCREKAMRVKFASGKTFVFILLLAALTAAVTAPDAIALVCGDGIPDASEECDDGNNASGDGCSAVCTVEREWTQFECAINTVDNSANGLFQVGDSIIKKSGSE